MIREFLLKISEKPELIVLGIMILVIAMLILPLPTYLVDFLVGLNIVISLLVLMSSFYITRILHFSSFPSLLLITTLFRLALSISTSRLILLDAEAGDIIASFGQFVIGDNLVVGIVIFSIVTIVQFIVITKGSERVAEVAARFSLDAMPGKQMSIDADLKSGLIDNEEVKKRRKELQQESQLYGSFDGAMKFIKGDAIAGIIIIFVNYLGGILVGMGQMGMGFSEALTTYTMLTIGDGLVAQIPALLISISAGFIVTRVDGNQTNLGQGIMKELFSNNFVLIVTAGLALFIGLLPGFPFMVFLLLAIIISFLYFKRLGINFSSLKKFMPSSPNDANLNTDQENDEDVPTLKRNDDEPLTEFCETYPLILLIPREYQDYVNEIRLKDVIKEKMLMEIGLLLPDIILTYSDKINNSQLHVLINEINAGKLPISFKNYKIENRDDNVDDAEFEPTLIVENGSKNSYWYQKEDKEKLQELGYEFRPDIDEIYIQLKYIISNYINEFLSIQETKNLLDKVEVRYPELLKECYRHVSIQRINEVLQRLIQEGISIRNIKVILGSLVQWGPKEKDPVMIVEHTRTSLARYISHSFSLNNQINVILVSSQIEELIRGGVRQTASGNYLNLEPQHMEELQDTILIKLKNQILTINTVVLTAPDIRRFMKKILEAHYPHLAVLSFTEIIDGIHINVLDTL